MKKEETLKKIKNGLIVSCQARKGWAMYGPKIMAAFSKAAEEGGAVGIRATDPENIRAIREVTDLPIIGIYKQWYEDFEVYITPTYQSAVDVIEAGANIVAIDGTQRPRPNNESLEEIVSKIHHNFPDILVMADCATLEEGKLAEKMNIDIVSTTLNGYTQETENIHSFDKQFVKDLTQHLKIPIIAEGHIGSKEDINDALNSGAFSIVIGTAITRPEIITKKFVENINNFLSN